MRKLFSILSTLIVFSLCCQAQLTSAKLPPGRTLADIKKHVMKPVNIIGTSADNDERDDFVISAETKLKFEKTKRYQLDVAAFADYFHKQIKDSVAGYVLQLSRGGNVISNLNHNPKQIR